jgi:hypothetical protein
MKPRLLEQRRTCNGCNVSTAVQRLQQLHLRGRVVDARHVLWHLSVPSPSDPCTALSVRARIDVCRRGLNTKGCRVAPRCNKSWQLMRLCSQMEPPQLSQIEELLSKRSLRSSSFDIDIGDMTAREDSEVHNDDAVQRQMAVLADGEPPQLLHSLLERPCSQMAEPPQLLLIYFLGCRACRWLSRRNSSYSVFTASAAVLANGAAAAVLALREHRWHLCLQMKEPPSTRPRYEAPHRRIAAPTLVTIAASSQHE